MIDRDFLLHNDTAKQLYACVKDLPIYDFHCHLGAKEIAENKPYENLAQIWLAGDHYKWRQMRTFGIDEKYITGNASDYDKFLAYASMLERAVGNPLYHWSHLELQKYFGIEEYLTRQSASDIWENSCAILRGKHIGPRELIGMSNVDTVCIIEDPFCDLSVYERLRGMTDTRILPAFRGDKFLHPRADAFAESVRNLCGSRVTFDNFLRSLKNRIEEFVRAGAVTADFAFESLGTFQCSLKDAEMVLQKCMNGEEISPIEEEGFRFLVLEEMLKMCYGCRLVVQLHIGAKRNNNAKEYKRLGPDTGYDSISLANYFDALQILLDRLNSAGALGKTILFNLNPNDTDALLTLIGCYQGGERGKLQLGAAWWFNDTLDGNKLQMKSYARLSMLDVSVGMLTDSRSFVSYPRFDYYRRILCDFLGYEAEKNGFNPEAEILQEIAKNVSYYNAKEYFNVSAAGGKQ